MPKAQTAREVAILNFFESAPLEKAEMLFNIVKVKMRARCAPNGPATNKKKETHSSRPPEVPFTQESEKA
jgi:hypothetical protein